MAKGPSLNSPAKNNLILPAPRVMLFDWHGTLVNTNDAMYQAIEEMLSQLEELDLVRHILPEDQAKTQEDEKLAHYIRIFRHLPPKVLAEKRITRTDIFDALFGDNPQANAIAHQAYNQCYRHHYGKVFPIQDAIYDYLSYLKKCGIKIGVVTNRNREFLSYELHHIESGRWKNLFDTILCGNEVSRYKPAPDSLQQAVAALDEVSGSHVWYVGDSVTDMVTASKAGSTSVFYNGALWQQDWFDHMLPHAQREHYKPKAIVNDFDHLLDLVESSIRHCDWPQHDKIHIPRPPRLPPRKLPPAREEPDWHPAIVDLIYPSVILFDWHATLVDTLDAMYHAVDDMLKDLRDLGLLDHLVDASQCKSPEDMKLVNYVRENLSLHPKIKLDRKISRTDIFEVLFGDNEVAKKIAHLGFNQHYRNYFGTALPFEPKVEEVLKALKKIGLTLGVITNRDREFFIHELGNVDGNSWDYLFTTNVCGDDTERRKPHIDQILKAAKNLNITIGPELWYVGDSTTDVIAAKSAGITSVFFNGALWDQAWLNKIFPGNQRYPHKPDVVVNDFSEFWALVLACRKRS
jgi:phosphoglycolate phosphatase